MNNEMANRMSLFYAEATPMLKTLSNATTHFVSEVCKGGEGSNTDILDFSFTGLLNIAFFLPFQNKTLPIENTTDCLSTMASVCKVMLETP